jgi:hypothetical protein
MTSSRRWRDYLAARIRPEAAGLADPILRAAAEDAIQGVEEGSFYRRVLHGLVTQIDQVRDYRNWVAHGRRERAGEMSNVTPQMAYERLEAFLAELGIATAPERPEAEGPAEGPE